MVYINNNSNKMTVLRAKTLKITKMELKNQTDKSVLTFDLSDSDVEYGNHTISINLGSIIEDIKVAGQYDYRLYNCDTVVESGILQFNDFRPQIETYNTKINIIQYEK